MSLAFASYENNQSLKLFEFYDFLKVLVEYFEDFYKEQHTHQFDFSDSFEEYFDSLVEYFDS